jgi:hypothetical protein
MSKLYVKYTKHFDFGNQHKARIAKSPGTKHNRFGAAAIKLPRLPLGLIPFRLGQHPVYTRLKVLRLCHHLLLLGVKFLLQRHTKLFSEGLELLKVLLVLALVLDLGLDTFKDADSSTEVVDPSGGLEGGSNHRGSRDKIVSEGVVEVALKLENILDTVELLLEPAGSRILAIECRGEPVQLHWKVFGGNRVGIEL